MFLAPTLAGIPYLTDRCQRFNIVGEHSIRERIRGSVAQCLGIRSGICRILLPSSEVQEDSDPLGVVSQFPEGSWVRVRDEASIRKTLDASLCLRGLRSTAGQWKTCSNVYRVAKVVRRVVDDERCIRPVSSTVLLHGLDCTTNGAGAACGRYCPTWYRDEWLEPADPPAQEPQEHHGTLRCARIRPLEQILSRLDLLGQREGLAFMPEMGRYSGTRARILQRVSHVLEYNRWVGLRGGICILEGLHCTGAVLGSDGPCDRACRFLWHTDWLEVDA